MYVMIFPLNGFDWIWLGFGMMADVASYVGAYHNRKQVPMLSGKRTVLQELFMLRTKREFGMPHRQIPHLPVT